MTTTNHTIGEDAANGAMGEREAFEVAYRRNFEFPEIADQHTFRKGWQAGIVFARAALTAEKVAGQEAVKDAAPAQSGEPVAYLYERKESREFKEVLYVTLLPPENPEETREYGFTVTPLYTAPQPSQPAQSGQGTES